MSKVKIQLDKAQNLAQRIKAELAPACSSIKIAGSIRRKKPIVGDIELVCIPMFSADLFGETTPKIALLENHLDSLVRVNRLIRGDKNGANYKNFFIPAIEGLKLDLFITNPECWPVIFAIRTGSADFSQRLVTPRSKGGLLPSHLRVGGGRVWDGDEPVKLESEQEFFELCGGWVEPEERT